MSLDDIISDVSALGGLPFSLIIIVAMLLLQEWGPFWQLIIGLVISYAIIAGVRSVYIRDRPKPVEYRTWWEKVDAGTAISMHACRATILAIVLMNFFRNIFLSTFLIVLALIVAWTRILLKKHYAADAVWGVVLGTAIGLIVLWTF
ncbi:MAG TPA: phosphatase PAP2 family protein [Candidatus Binatia bacterium]|nr:phosphatase PAP2 family protein [Candidatus Binatia bacterium]